MFSETRNPWQEGYYEVLIREEFGPHKYDEPAKRERVVEGKKREILELDFEDFGIFYCDEPFDNNGNPCELSLDAIMCRESLSSLTEAINYCRGVEAAIKSLRQ